MLEFDKVESGLPEKVLSKLNLRQNWDNLKMTEALKLLFKEVIVPHFKSTPERTSILQSSSPIDLSKIKSRNDLSELFEKLVFRNLLAQMSD